jgi:hypothetical protein
MMRLSHGATLAHGSGTSNVDDYPGTEPGGPSCAYDKQQIIADSPRRSRLVQDQDILAFAHLPW